MGATNAVGSGRPPLRRAAAAGGAKPPGAAAERCSQGSAKCAWGKRGGAARLRPSRGGGPLLRRHGREWSLSGLAISRPRGAGRLSAGRGAVSGRARTSMRLGPSESNPIRDQTDRVIFFQNDRIFFPRGRGRPAAPDLAAAAPYPAAAAEPDAEWEAAIESELCRRSGKRRVCAQKRSREAVEAQLLLLGKKLLSNSSYGGDPASCFVIERSASLDRGARRRDQNPIDNLF